MAIFQAKAKPNGTGRTLLLANRWLNDAKNMIRTTETMTDFVEDGLRAAKRRARHGLHMAEDLMDEAVVRVRRQPLRAAGWAFTSGALAGVAATWSWIHLRKVS